MRPPETQKFALRFMSKVRKGPGCWEWTGAQVGGYGVTHVGRKNKYVHRLSFEHSSGVIPTGMLVCHRCDNRACVRPSHLFLGTPLTNNQDMWRKGRANPKPPLGVDHYRAVLTPAKVRKIKAALLLKIPQKTLALKFGVRRAAISKIATGRTWKTVYAAS